MQPTAPTQHRLRPRTLLLASIAAAALGGLLVALRPGPVSVDIAETTRGPMKVTINEEGKTRVSQIYTVSAPVTGKLRRSAHDPGDPVIMNQTVIAVIEPSAPVFLDARTRREAEAQVSAARASVTLTEAELRQAETELSWAASELQRSRTLSQTNVVAARVVERAKLEHEKQLAAVARAKAALAVRNSELATALAHLIGPESNQATPGTGQDCCVEVRSPKSGAVLRELQESERVVIAGTPILEIGDPTDLEVVVELLSTDAVRIQAGADAVIEGAGLTEPLSARVRRIEPAAFTKVSALGIEEQRVRVYLTLTTPVSQWARLGHDYRVFARITAWKSDAALRLPLSAMFRNAERWSVYRVLNGRASLTAVDVGQRNNEHAEVLSGVSPGDQIVLHPSDRVVHGTRVIKRRDSTAN